MKDVAHPLNHLFIVVYVDLPMDQGAIHHLAGNLAGINPSAYDLDTHGRPHGGQGVTFVPPAA